MENFEELRDAGLFGIMVPKEFGGFGANFATYTRAIEQIAKNDSSTALTFNMHNITVGSLSELDAEIRSIGGSRGRVMGEFWEWMYDQAVNQKTILLTHYLE